MRSYESVERKCDLEARKILGQGRGSSVFPVPCRGSIHAKSYREAHEINKENVSRGLSQQTWGIIPKILEVDNLLRENEKFRNQIQESHPEIAFWALNNKTPLKFNKKSSEGIDERLSILEKFECRTREIFEAAIQNYMRKEVSKDDIVDAICMAITGRVAVDGNYKTIPTNIEVDLEGIEMKIVYYGGVV